MPVFGFKCSSCEWREDVIVLPGEDAPTGCPDCGEPVKRTFGGRVGVRLEGWGFSKTDGLVAERPGGRRSFRELRERADRIRDE